MRPDASQPTRPVSHRRLRQQQQQENQLSTGNGRVSGWEESANQKAPRRYIYLALNKINIDRCALQGGQARSSAGLWHHQYSLKEAATHTHRTRRPAFAIIRRAPNVWVVDQHTGRTQKRPRWLASYWTTPGMARSTALFTRASRCMYVCVGRTVKRTREYGQGKEREGWMLFWLPDVLSRASTTGKRSNVPCCPPNRNPNRRRGN